MVGQDALCVCQSNNWNADDADEDDILLEGLLTLMVEKRFLQTLKWEIRTIIYSVIQKCGLIMPMMLVEFALICPFWALLIYVKFQ